MNKTYTIEGITEHGYQVDQWKHCFLSLKVSTTDLNRIIKSLGTYDGYLPTREFPSYSIIQFKIEPHKSYPDMKPPCHVEISFVINDWSIRGYSGLSFLPTTIEERDDHYELPSICLL